MAVRIDKRNHAQLLNSSYANLPVAWLAVAACSFYSISSGGFCWILAEVEKEAAGGSSRAPLLDVT